MEKQSNNSSRRLSGLLLTGFILWAGLGCAPQPQTGNKVGTLPEVDILQMKENSDVALRMAQQTRISIDALNTRLTELEKTVEQLALDMEDQPRARIEEQQNQIILLQEDILALRRHIDEMGKTATFQTRPSSKSPPEILPPTPPLYREALRAFDAKSYAKSIELFDRFVSSHNDDTWADDAWYWMGESWFRLGDYGQATSALRKVFSYPRSDKADDAQFLLAQCFQKLGDRERALAEYKQIEILYPHSEYVRKAQQEIQKLGSQ